MMEMDTKTVMSQYGTRRKRRLECKDQSNTILCVSTLERDNDTRALPSVVEHEQRRPQRGFQRGGKRNAESFSKMYYLLILLTSLALLVTQISAQDDVNWLSNDSVVLLVGATTSLLGSEVALALYRLFGCRVILIDDLNSAKPGDLIGTLSTLEFHRQSLFRIWQEVDDRLTLYRMSPRPIIPDINPGATLDRLAHVFEKHRPTHIVIFPDTPESYRGETDEAPPRAGMLEGLLEQVRSFREKNSDAPLPHVVWTSSEQVYPTTGVWSEKDVPPMPRTKDGADAMMNEIIAQAYDAKGVPSVALRLSSHIYGPFHEPSGPLFNAMENILRKQFLDIEIPYDGDYLFVDDAVDALLAALQLPHVSHTFAINVATGKSVLTKDQILDRVRKVITGEQVEAIENQGRRLNIALAERVLNFSPRVSLTEGLKRSLAWHYDRLYPYGAGDGSSPEQMADIARMYGVASCDDASDTECLHGVPILPCASECSHKQTCRPTIWDDLIPKLESWTAACPNILYTIRRSPDLKSFAISPNSKAHWPDAHCNIAFYPSLSPGQLNIRDSWTHVPVQMNLTDVDTWLMPLWSPGALFPRSQFAIYRAPNVVLDDLDKLLDAVYVQPEGKHAETALLIGVGDDSRAGSRNLAQRDAYRAIYIKATELFDREALYDGFLPSVDAHSWMVHRLGNSDSEQLRCDISKELAGWKGLVDLDAAAAFVFGLHDLWNQVLLHQNGQKPWWHGNNVVSVPVAQQKHRRLEEISSDEDVTQRAVEAKNFQEEDGPAAGQDEETDDAVEDIHHFDQNGFGVARKSIGAVLNNPEDRINKNPSKSQQNKVDLKSQIDDSTKEEPDPSKYDTWLGVLSSTDTPMFVRLVEQKFVGVVFLDELNGSLESS